MCLMAACSGAGVDLEVTSEVAIDRVELFIANDHCYKDDGALCDGVAWQTMQQRPPGDVYVMKGDEDIVQTTRFDGMRAVMHLEATPEFREPKVLALVGFSGDTAVSFATIWGPRIPANSAETWQIELEAADDAKPAFMVPPGDGETTERVHAWKRERVDHPDDLSRCLAMQSWDDTEGEWKGVFIVPDSDPDCDGREVECDPLHANFNVGGGPTACVKTVTSFAAMPCVIGAALCEDGVSETGACLPVTTPLQCAPQEICSACEDDPGLVACAATAAKSDPAVSGVECTFQGSDSGNTCGQGKVGSATRISLPVNCSAVEVRPLSMPLSSSATPDRAMVASGVITVSLSTPASGTANCAIDLAWVTGNATAGDTALFAFIVTGRPTTNTLILPVRITMGQPVTNCTTVANEPVACVENAALATDSMLSCLQ
jgi:hypothetical protein